MYGLVNKAVKGLIIQEYGQALWDKIRLEIGFNEDEFLSFESYPDKLTYDIVGQASRETGVSGADLLRAFGEYWVLYTADEGYGQLMSFSGKSFSDFLKNLNLLHERVADLMPSLQPPSFRTAEETENSIVLHYSSKRKGFEPMVEGLIVGLAKRFQIEVNVKVLPIETEEGAQSNYLINW